MLGTLGRPDDSIAEIRKAAEVDPLSIPVRNMLAARLQTYDRCDEALAEDNKTLELVPNAVHLGMLHVRMADCYRKKHMETEAVEEEVKARLANGASAKDIENFRRVYAASGMKGVRQQDLQEHLRNWDKDHWHLDAFEIALAYADLGDLDHAFAWIDKAIEMKCTLLFWLWAGENPLRMTPELRRSGERWGFESEIRGLAALMITSSTAPLQSKHGRERVGHHRRPAAKRPGPTSSQCLRFTGV